jgi:heme/copper-type cytochrome/quinol oxidase subunit 2
MGNPFELPDNGVRGDWLIFVAILLSVGIGIACFFIWFFMFRKTNKKKRKKRHRHHRQHNPTLAESGGLPPVRDPNQPPRGV